MLKKVKDEISKTLGKPLPRDIGFEYDDVGKILYIILKKEAIGFYKVDSNNTKPDMNMQRDKAAFEGWALVVKTRWKKDEKYKIQLVIKLGPDEKLMDFSSVLNKHTSLNVDSGHYGRFLYRVWKFQEEFSEWFDVSYDIKVVKDKYVDLLLDPNHSYTNHLPDNEAGVNKNLEISVEKAFSDHPEELSSLLKNPDIKTVYRQLGCWLEDAKNPKRKFLTAGKSAIDLWSRTGDVLNIFELKAHRKNNGYKVGILTELFFYVEYCKDFYTNAAHFELRKPSENIRGYKYLYDSVKTKKCDEVKGYFLANVFHPLITDEVINLLNTNKSKIEFKKVTYELDKIESLINP